MSTRFPALAVVLATAALASAGQAAAPRRTACTQQGLTGVWSLQSVTAAEKGVQDERRQAELVNPMGFVAAAEV